MHVKYKCLYICLIQIDNLMKKFFKITLISAMLSIIGYQGADASNENEAFSEPSKKNVEFITLNPVGASFVDEAEMNSISPWAFPAHTLDIVDSYMPFIFRTKKSAAIDELKVIINVNRKGKISGYDVLNENADKGLIERVGYVVRNMPKAQPVPGFDNYEAMSFELVIRK